MNWLKITKPMSGNVLYFEKFKFERVATSDGVKIVFFCNGKLVKAFAGCPGMGRKETNNINYANIYKMFPGEDYQAVIFVSNCGAKRQGSYEVINLRKDGTYYTLFDSTDYETPGYFAIYDLNNDGFCEILDCADEPFNDSELIEFQVDKVDPIEIFAYDREAKKIVPANNMFKKELKDLSGFDEANVDKNDVRSVLELCSYYWYSGEMVKGWNLFGKYYRANDRESKKNKIREALQNDKYIAGLNAKK